MCVHTSVPVCRGSQRSTRGILPSPHLSFQQSLSLKLELPSWLGGLDGKAPGPCLCLPNAGVTETSLHSDAFRSVLPSFHAPFSREFCICAMCFDHTPNSKSSKSSPILSIICSQLPVYVVLLLLLLSGVHVFGWVESLLLVPG